MSQVPEHFYTQSAVIPYRERNGAIEVLMITSRKRKRWVIPKGVREPELPQLFALVGVAGEFRHGGGDLVRRLRIEKQNASRFIGMLAAP